MCLKRGEKKTTTSTMDCYKLNVSFILYIILSDLHCNFICTDYSIVSFKIMNKTGEGATHLRLQSNLYLEKKWGWGTVEVEEAVCMESRISPWTEEGGRKRRSNALSQRRWSAWLCTISLHGPLPLSTPLCLSAPAAMHLIDSPPGVAICMLWRFLSFLPIGQLTCWHC